LNDILNTANADNTVFIALSNLIVLVISSSGIHVRDIQSNDDDDDLFDDVRLINDEDDGDTRC
jgi:hypothetical protein